MCGLSCCRFYSILPNSNEASCFNRRPFISLPGFSRSSVQPTRDKVLRGMQPVSQRGENTVRAGQRARHPCAAKITALPLPVRTESVAGCSDDGQRGLCTCSPQEARQDLRPREAGRRAPRIALWRVELLGGRNSALTGAEILLPGGKAGTFRSRLVAVTHGAHCSFGSS